MSWRGKIQEYECRRMSTQEAWRGCFISAPSKLGNIKALKNTLSVIRTRVPYAYLYVFLLQPRLMVSNSFNAIGLGSARGHVNF